MERVQSYRLEVTRSTVGNFVLLLAILTHISLALGKLAARSTLKMPLWEASQLTLGLSIPILILPHVFNQKTASLLLGKETAYHTVLAFLWTNKPIMQSLALIVVWIHACIGLHFWLRLSKFYRKVFLLLFALAVIIPLAGLAGFMVAGRDAVEMAQNKISQQQQKSNSDETSGYSDDVYGTTTGDRESSSTSGYGYEYGGDYDTEGKTQAQSTYDLNWWMNFLLILFYSLLSLALLVVWMRKLIAQGSKTVSVSYVAGPELLTSAGPTLLEISRMHNVPHMSVCGGRARCSTCRVRITSGLDQFSPPAEVEAATLLGINAPPDVRLACQIRPRDALTVVRIVPPLISQANILDPSDDVNARGVEQELVVIFIDVRGFTRMTADKLPYDVVYILNQFFDAAGEAIVSENGWIDKYMGDGLMAVFGRNDGPGSGCRQALRAAKDIDFALDRVNKRIASEIPNPLQIGIGLHVGPLVLGKIGYRNTSAMTVIGRTVNAAARLEALTKEKNCQVIVSAAVADLAGLETSSFERETVTVRGLHDPIDVFFIPRGRDIEL